MPDYYYVLGLMLRTLGDEKASEEALTKYASLRGPWLIPVSNHQNGVLWNLWAFPIRAEVARGIVSHFRPPQFQGVRRQNSRL